MASGSGKRPPGVRRRATAGHPPFRRWSTWRP